MDTEGQNYGRQSGNKFQPNGISDEGYLHQPETPDEEEVDMDEGEQDGEEGEADTSLEQPQDYQEQGYDQDYDQGQNDEETTGPEVAPYQDGAPVDVAAAQPSVEPREEVQIEVDAEPSLQAHVPTMTGESTPTATYAQSSAPVTPDGKPGTTSTPKSLKDRISESKCSCLSLFNVKPFIKMYIPFLTKPMYMGLPSRRDGGGD